MIKVHITDDEVEQSKRLRDSLDSHKTYNKLNCSNNFIGALGEIKLNDYLKENQFNYVWHEYINDSYDCPDFIVNGATIDLKTTYSEYLWFQKPKHDIYIQATMSPDNKFLLLSGFILKENMMKVAKQVVRGTRIDYIIDKKDLLPMSWLDVVTRGKQNV